MFLRIISFVMSLFTILTVTVSQFSFKSELKNELSKGNYESPYIVRPLDDITVNGISVDEYSVVISDSSKNDLLINAAETLCNEIYDACGKMI